MGYLIFFGAHLALVALIKGIFAKEIHVKGKFSKLAAILNITSSQLVYVRIMPLVGDASADNSAKESREEEHHRSTFFSQFLFSVLVLVENLGCNSIQKTS